MSLGQIKDYTPNFNLIIPRFDIATWHDYMESNFRSIDALFFNMFGINQYRGEWQNSTTYQVGDVLFIGDPNSQYTGRLIKVLVVHTTTANDSFDVYYAHNPINYDLFMDAAAAEQAAKLARDWAIKTDGKVQGLDYSAKYYVNLITPISSEIVNVSNISNEIINTSNISTNIINVDTISEEIISVSNKLNEIITNSNNISSIIINSNNINNINTTANNINDIITTSSNIIDIQNASTNAQIAKTSAENAQNSAEIAEFYAKNVKFGMFKELFSVNTWTQENNKYYIEYDYNIVSGVYKLNLNNYELMTNIDVKDLGNKVRIYSVERFEGFVLLVNSAEESQTIWGNITGTLSAQTDLQNALNTKEDVISDLSNIRSGAALGTTSLQPNDNISELNNNVGYITGITSSDVTTALGYTPYNSSNPSNYQTATQVANSIATETTNRENADNNLQSQIDAIVSSSDVFDIVGTYAELQAYDITTVPVNDIIKVLVDSTHSGAATYYRCVETGGVKSWLYIGSEGAYYTKGEADAAFVPQTRTVNNKALSSNITLTASDVGADVSGSASTAETNAKNYADGLSVNYATAAQGALAVTAVQPDDLSSYVTKNTAQDITARKTFLGEKAIYFKQSTPSNKLGFTLYDNNNKEAAAFEYRPNTINSYPLLYLGQFKGIETNYISTPIYVGFRCYDYAYKASYNLVAPLAKDAKTPFNLNTVYKTLYLPLGITDGNTTVVADSTGVANISTLLPTIATSVSSSSTNSETVGAKLFYDTCGDIETLINAL